MPVASRKAPLTDRDAFVDMVAVAANGHLGSVSDAITAMWTNLDVARLARRTGKPSDYLMAERSAARMRILKAVGLYDGGGKQQQQQHAPED